MDFIELKAACRANYIEILIAELSEIGFDSFVEHSFGFDAYTEPDRFNEEGLKALAYQYAVSANFKYQINQVEKKNWNEEWEKSYQPIFIDTRCVVKASFHQLDRVYPIEIIINPKMSFGTGHHETTFQMLSQQLDLNFKGKRVLDAGCGTGILSVMSSKLGAETVEACDIDEWCIENARENFTLNQTANIHVALGSTGSLHHHLHFDIILANINRNVLLDEIPLYASLLVNGGNMVLSGFFESDVKDLEALAGKHNLYKLKQTLKNKWASVLFEKKI